MNIGCSHPHNAFQARKYMHYCRLLAIAKLDVDLYNSHHVHQSISFGFRNSDEYKVVAGVWDMSVTDNTQTVDIHRVFIVGINSRHVANIE